MNLRVSLGSLTDVKPLSLLYQSSWNPVLRPTDDQTSPSRRQSSPTLTTDCIQPLLSHYGLAQTRAACVMNGIMSPELPF